MTESAENSPGGASHLVLGTAGHIDHGKTALVRALTGIDTDRLPEEKARGITIELGFAQLELPGGTRAGVVDVPGHEKLVRTMVAGATGIDVLLLVVAADEGVMPQTREHIAICDLLGLRTGVIALTKSDLVDEEILELAEAEILELLAGTGLEGAAVMPVSSVTGAGIDELKEAIEAILRTCDPLTARGGPPRLSVDRIFASKGFGTVVTGTLVGGPLIGSAAVSLYPRDIRARIRGLQTHGIDAERVEPGSRCAVNLQAIDAEQISRGDVLSLPGALLPTQTFDARVRWLGGAPPVEGPTSIELLVGSAERRARLAPIGTKILSAGESGFARIHIDGPPIVVLPDDLFVARGFARGPEFGATFGGGVVIDVNPPRRRRSDPELLAELDGMWKGDLTERIALRIHREGLGGHLEDLLGPELGLLGDELPKAIADLLDTGRAVRASGGVLVDIEAIDRIEARLTTALEAFHEAEPLRPGMPKGALLGQLPGNVRPEAARLALERLVDRGAARVQGDDVSLTAHAASLTPEQEKSAEQILTRITESGLDPPGPRTFEESLGLTQDEVANLLGYLERGERITRAPGDLFFASEVVQDLARRVVAHFESNTDLDTQQYKALIGTSRRAAMPLMALLDDMRITRRTGSVRVLLDASGAAD